MDPSLFTALCGLLIVVSLGIQHGLQVGTFPARAHFLEPYRSFLACLPGGATAGLMAASTGATWQQALAAGLSGCAGGLQGAFAAFWPKATPPARGSSSSSSSPPAAPTLPSARGPASGGASPRAVFLPRRSAYGFARDHLRALGLSLRVGGS